MQLISEAIEGGVMQALAERTTAPKTKAQKEVEREIARLERIQARPEEDVAERIAKREAKLARRALSAG